MPCSSATVHCTKSWSTTKTPWPLTTTRCKQYLSAVHPLTCRLLWVRCLFDPSKFGVLGANDPWMKTFHKFLSKIGVSPMIHVSWPNLAKISRCEVAKKSSRIAYKKIPGVGDTFERPFHPHLTDRAQNFVNVVGPWPVHVYQLWSGSAAVCRTYSGKSAKKWIQYRLSAYNKSIEIQYSCIAWISARPSKMPALLCSQRQQCCALSLTVTGYRILLATHSSNSSTLCIC